MTPKLTRGPTEKDVADRLHEPLAVHDTLSVVGEDALAGIRLQHRVACLFDLENQRISIAVREQRHHASGADAADADHLDRGIPDFVAVEQYSRGWRQTFAIEGESLLDHRVDLPGPMPLHVEDCRKLVFDDRGLAPSLLELGKEI